jgi:hypothetical protein
MNKENPNTAITPFERIRRTNPTGSEFWSSRDFVQVLGYTDYRNFEAVIEKARTACFNSGQRVEDHFVEITEMVEIGSRAQQPHINKRVLDESLLVVPDEPTLKAYTSIAAPQFLQIKNYHQQNRELTQLRDWLLPMLMNGQVTVA